MTFHVLIHPNGQKHRNKKTGLSKVSTAHFSENWNQRNSKDDTLFQWGLDNPFDTKYQLSSAILREFYEFCVIEKE